MIRSEEPVRYVCLFPEAENVHLVKDVGMMPAILSERWEVDASLVCLDRGQKFPYLEALDQKLSIRRLENDERYRPGGRMSNSVRAFLRETARDIDVLQLFHFTKESVETARFFRKLNPHGLVYLKLDISPDNFLKDLSSMGGTWNLPHHWFLASVPTVLSAETELALRVFVHRYPLCKSKTILLPNGYDDGWLGKQGHFLDLRDAKENLLITVGRIGTEPKNSEMLLDSLRSLDLEEWRVAFIGPIEETFQPTIERFFEERPDLVGRVIFTGNLQNRDELYDWYRRAKVFCLTSRWESFCLAMVDALAFGCWLATTPVASANDLTGEGVAGTVFTDRTELDMFLKSCFTGRFDPLTRFDAVVEHSRSFAWSRICDQLADRINRSVENPIFRRRAHPPDAPICN
ncbi:MAG: glycosyltransferase [Fibrobacterota bacterium]|mgnify:FL=1